MHKQMASKHIHLFLIILVLTASNVSAQQDAGYTYYMYNTLAVNPAYAGVRNSLSINVLHRSQWVGFDGAPTTESLSAAVPILKKHAGIGISIVSDRIGYISTNAVYSDFAYRLNIDKHKQFLLGLKVGVNFRRAKFSEIELENPSDQDFGQDYKSSLLPNIGFGVLYVTDKFYAGLSVPKMIENDFEPISVSRSALSGERKHFYLIAGHLHKINSDWMLKSSLLVRATRFAPMIADISAQFIYEDKFWLGPMFRFGDAAGLLAGIIVSNQLQLGYAFDFSYKNLTGQYNYGSHEILINYTVPESGKKVCPAYF